MKNIIDELSHLFLFRNIDIPEIERLFDTEKADIRSFNRYDEILSPGECEKKMGFVLSGQCEVRRSKREDPTVVLNTLERYDSFGVLTVFSVDSFPTYIYAKKASKILFISKCDIERMIDKNPKIAKNVICFMADRISFLNSKINTFSGANVEARVACYLISQKERFNSTSFPINCKKCSESINIGRASVYRAMSSLCERGLITLDTKKINILDLAGLERISK